MTSIKSTLETARRKIALPENWTKGEFGFSNQYGPVHPWSDLAECWCIRGAIYAVGGGWTTKQSAQAMMHVENTLAKYTSWPSSLLANWNDHPQTTHNDVISLLDSAIAEAPDG